MDLRKFESATEPIIMQICNQKSWPWEGQSGFKMLTNLEQGQKCTCQITSCLALAENTETC